MLTSPTLLFLTDTIFAAGVHLPQPQGGVVIPLDQRFSTQVTLPLGLSKAVTGMGKDRPTPMSTHPQEKH